MKVGEYTEHVLSVKSPHFDNDSVKADLIHAIMGLVTEAAELEEAIDAAVCFENLDEVNICEEFGDLLWYLALGYYSLGHPIQTRDSWIPKSLVDTSVDFSFESIVRDTVISAGKLMDICKRAFFYGKGAGAVDITNVLPLFDNMYFTILRGIKHFDKDIEEVMDINIRKLYFRYPDKFKTDSAYIRDLESERKLLEERK